MLLLLWRLVIEEGSGISVSKGQLLSQPEKQRMVYLYLYDIKLCNLLFTCKTLFFVWLY